MAVVKKDDLERIAKRIANENYQDEIDKNTEELRLHILAYMKEITPESVVNTFALYPRYFKRIDRFGFPSYNYKQYLPEDWGSRTFHGYVDLNCEIPICDESTYEIMQGVPENHYIKTLLRNFFKLEMERYFMEKRLKCVFQTTRFTDAKLKEQFPEAYKIYLDIITSDTYDEAKTSDGATGTLCDTIENLRAQLKSNRDVKKDV